MSLAGAAANGLQAALLLARGRAEGIGLFSDDRSTAARSFLAMAFCVPAVIALRVMAWVGAGPPAGASRTLGRDLLVYTAATLGFAVVSFHLMPWLGREKQWPRFIAAWNWCNVIENTLLVLGAVPGVLGAPPMVDQAAQLFTTGWALWIEWYAIRTSLAVGPMAAIGLLLVDETIGLVLIVVGVAFNGS